MLRLMINRDRYQRRRIRDLHHRLQQLEQNAYSPNYSSEEDGPPSFPEGIPVAASVSVADGSDEVRVHGGGEYSPEVIEVEAHEVRVESDALSPEADAIINHTLGFEVHYDPDSVQDIPDEIVEFVLLE